MEIGRFRASGARHVVEDRKRNRTIHVGLLCPQGREHAREGGRTRLEGETVTRRTVELFEELEDGPELDASTVCNGTQCRECRSERADVPVSGPDAVLNHDDIDRPVAKKLRPEGRAFAGRLRLREKWGDRDGTLAGQTPERARGFIEPSAKGEGFRRLAPRQIVDLLRQVPAPARAMRTAEGIEPPSFPLVAEGWWQALEIHGVGPRWIGEQANEYLNVGVIRGLEQRANWCATRSSRVIGPVLVAGVLKDDRLDGERLEELEDASPFGISVIELRLVQLDERSLEAAGAAGRRSRSSGQNRRPAG